MFKVTARTLTGIMVSAVMFLAGCMDASAPTATHLPETSSTMTTISPSPRPSQTSTTPPVYPTDIPTPTLSPDWPRLSFMELISTNGGCDLPCFYGGRLIPGKTPDEDTNAFLVAIHGEWKMGVASTFIPEPTIANPNSYEVDLTLTRREGILQRINLTGSLGPGQTPPDNAYWRAIYGWNQILAHNGVPSDIRAQFTRAKNGLPPHYQILLRYIDKGMVIDYWGPAKEIGQSQVQACPQLDQVVSIRLGLVTAASDGSPSFLPPEWLSGWEITTISGDQLPTLSEQVGMSNEQFYDTFKTEGSVKCFTASETSP